MQATRDFLQSTRARILTKLLIYGECSFRTPSQRTKSGYTLSPLGCNAIRKRLFGMVILRQNHS
jgi:hypothetical protein